MRCFRVTFSLIMVAAVFVAFARTSLAEEPAKPLKMLRKMYLSVHSGGDFNDTCSVSLVQPRFLRMCEQWPGRTEAGCAAERKFMEKYRQLIGQAKEDEGIFFVPTKRKSDNELIALARKHFGDRSVVCNYKSELLGDDWGQRLEEDRKRAVARRGPNLTAMEIGGWNASKAWATDLKIQLNKRGYTFDPETVEFIAFGGDWMYCCGTYPIHMARAWGLAKGITRPFDMILKDESPLFMKLEVVDQNLRMPENIDLFIFKTPNEGPTWGRYIAQYYERAHGLMDPLHVVEVDFPPNSVTEINIFGWGVARALGIGGQYDRRGRTVMHVGCGGHVNSPPTLVMAEDKLSLEDFRAALLAGKVSEKK